MERLHNNPPSFADDVEAVRSRGTLVVAWDRVKIAAADPRLHRPHLHVLIELMDCLNHASGTAWPSREWLAMRCRIAVKTVKNVLYDLRKFGYISWEKRTIKGRRLVHYTPAVAQYDQELIIRHIEAVVSKLPARAGNSDTLQSRRKAVCATLNARNEGQNYAPAREQTAPLSNGQQEPSQLPVKLIDAAEPTSVKEGRGFNQRDQGSRLPDDWVLPAAWAHWALEQYDVGADQVRNEAQRFRDFWMAKAGAGAIKRDWFATWRVWCSSDIRNWRRRRPVSSTIAPELSGRRCTLTADPWAEVKAQRRAGTEND